MKNNFNCNCDGLSIRAQLGLDNDQSQYNFDENLTRIKEGLWFYTDWQNLKPVEESELYIVTDETRENVIETIIEYDNVNDIKYRKEVRDMTNAELQRELDRCGAYYDDCDEDMFGLDLENYEKIETKGYSQGNYAEVIIPKTKLAELWGIDSLGGAEIDSRKLDIGHYFWDSPFFFTLEVDGETILETQEVIEELDTEYETNTSVVLCAVAKQLHKMKYTDEQQQEINGFLTESFPKEYID